MKLLHIDSSIMGEKSVSRVISAAIVQRVESEFDGLSTIYRDLAADPIDHLALRDLGSPAALAILDEFMESDIIVIGAGLYNFTVPTQLKAWIDRILIAGRTFRYGENGRPEGLAGGKRVIVGMSRGGNYGEGSPIQAFEHGEKLLRTAFGFIGIRDIQFFVADGVSRGEEERRVAVAGALERVSQMSLGAPAA